MKKRIWLNKNEFIEVGGKNMASLLQEIAVRKNAAAFSILNLALPNPDPILKKQNKGITIYRDLIVDPHVWACIQSRKSGVLSMNWSIDRGKSLSRLSRFIDDLFRDMDIDRIISEMLDAVLFGYQPMEVLWNADGSQVLPKDVVGKPAEWFQFDSRNHLRYAPPFRDKLPADSAGYPVPEFKFLLPRYNASYQNPYGEPVMARVFWSVTFKKGGFKFWVTFAEKFGMPYLIGKHPRGIGETEIDAMADTLELMIQDAIAVIPDDSSVDILESQGKGDSSGVYNSLVQICNAEISKAILGQTLTTEVGSKGSYAASQTHFDVRQDIIEMDRRLVETTFNQLIDWIIQINFGGSQPPRFILWQEEDVDKDLAERDKILSDTGVRFTKDYLVKAYGFEEGDFDISQPPSRQPAQFAETRSRSDQDILDDLIDALQPLDLQDQMETILESTIRDIKNGKNFQEVQAGIAAQFPDMKTEDLERLMQRIVFISEIWGRINAR